MNRAIKCCSDQQILTLTNPIHNKIRISTEINLRRMKVLPYPVPKSLNIKLNQLLQGEPSLSRQICSSVHSKRQKYHQSDNQKFNRTWITRNLLPGSIVTNLRAIRLSAMWTHRWITDNRLQSAANKWTIRTIVILLIFQLPLKLLTQRSPAITSETSILPPLLMSIMWLCHIPRTRAISTENTS